MSESALCGEIDRLRAELAKLTADAGRAGPSVEEAWRRLMDVGECSFRHPENADAMQAELAALRCEWQSGAGPTVPPDVAEAARFYLGESGQFHTGPETRVRKLADFIVKLSPPAGWAAKPRLTTP